MLKVLQFQIMKCLPFMVLLVPFFALSQARFEPIRESIMKSKKYEYVHGFENGYAVFRTFNNKSGLLDTAGNEIIKPIFTYISTNASLQHLFEAGNEIEKKFKRGFIDVKGEIRIPFQYDDVFYLGNGLIRVRKNDKTGVVDTLNKIILPMAFTHAYYDNDLLIARQNEILRLYNLEGSIISLLKLSSISRFKKNRAIAAFPDKTNAVIDNKGSIVLNCPKGYKLESILDDGSYLISNTANSQKGVLDTNGLFQIKCQYNELAKFGEFFIAKKGKKHGIISLSDSIHKPFIYDFLNYSFFENYIDESNPYSIYNFWAVKNQFQGIINPRKKEDVIPIKFQFISPLSDKYYIVKNNSNKNGLYYIHGDTIMKEEYEFFNHFENKIFATKNNKTYIIVLEGNTYQEMETQPERFVQHIHGDIYSNHPYQIFLNNGKYGVLNIENKIMIPCVYDKIQNVYHSIDFIVKQGNKYGIVNANHQVTVAVEYDGFSIAKEVIIFSKTGDKNQLIHPISYR